MKRNPHYIKVILDKDATIIEFECTLREVKGDLEDVVGKNWFDTFIATTDKDAVLEVFKDFFTTENSKWVTYENDIKCIDGTYRLIDFINEIIVKDGEQFLSSFGVEHYDNKLPNNFK